MSSPRSRRGRKGRRPFEENGERSPNSLKGCFGSVDSGVARRRGLGVHVWTVNTRKEMRRLIDLGVDNIITDRPEVLRALLDERAALSDVERLLLAIGRRLRSRE